MPTLQVLESTLRRMGRISLIAYGIGLLLTVVGFYLILGYDISAASNFQTYPPSQLVLLSLVVASFTFLLITGVFALLIGGDVGRGFVPRMRTLLAIVCYSIFLALLGILEIYLSFESSFRYPGLSTSGVLHIASATLIVVGSAVFRTEARASKTIGSILGITGVTFFFIVAVDLGNTSAGFSMLYLFQGTLPLSGILGGPLGAIGFLVSGIGAVVYSLVKASRSRRVSYVIATMGFFFLGMGNIVPSLTFLSGPVWQVPNRVLPVLSVTIVGMIFVAFAGFLIVACSGLGIILYAGQLQSVGMSPRGTDAIGDWKSMIDMETSLATQTG